MIEKINSIMRQNESISYKEMAEMLGVTLRHCERLIAQLKKDGKISRIGTTRSGRWIIHNIH